MLHEEIPVAPGVDCEGLQIFVKLPDSDELSSPSAFHLNEEQLPALVRWFHWHRHPFSGTGHEAGVCSCSHRLA